MIKAQIGEKALRLFCILTLLTVCGLSCNLLPQSSSQPTPEASATATTAITQPAGTPMPLATVTAGTQLSETAPAIPLPGQLPEDIPIMGGEKSAFVGSNQAISYLVDADFSTVVEFYEDEMAYWGWNRVAYGTRLTDAYAELPYEKEGRKAIVVIATVPFVDQTSVVITLEG